MQDYRSFVKSDYTYLEPRALLCMPVSVLLGVSSDAEEALKLLQIFSIFDLGASRIFANAKRIIEASQESGDLFERYGGVASDMVDRAAHALEIADLPTQPIEILDGIGSASGSNLAKALPAETVHDLAYWPPYIAATQLVTSILVPERLKTYDPEAPADLIPSSGEHPTEKISYTTVVISEVDGTKLQELDGQVDIADLSQGGTGSSKPATGAIITAEQTWFAQGVALGSLLHSIALAPGESTRIAMVDWTRRTTAQTEEETEQKEDLRNETAHSRSISEVTRAVANETQHGSSVSTSLGLSGNLGFAGGFVALPVMAQGISAGGAATYGRATMVSASSGQRNLFADMTQDVSDRTLQVASSVRNRRASIVQEVTQQEKETLTTRTITNYNHMHALSVQYYEIVQIYRVTTRVSKVEKCLFIPMKVIDYWTSELIDRFRNILIMALPEGSLRKALSEGTDLVEIKRYDLMMPNPHNFLRRVSEETLTELLDKAREITGRQVAEGIAATWRLPAETKLTGISANGTHNYLRAVINLRDGSSQVVKQGSSLEDPLLLSDILSIHLVFDTITVKRLNDQNYDPINDPSYYAGWPGLNSQCKLTLRYGGMEFVHWIINKAPHNDWYKEYLTEERASGFDEGPDRPAYRVEVECPALAFTPRGVAVGQHLINYFQQNRVYYSQTIWLNMDTPSLTLLLSKYKYNGKPLLQQIDPIPVAVTSNYLGFRMHADPVEDKDWRNWLKNHGFYEKDGQSLKNTAAYDTVPLPSGGVFAEAVLGRFNSAEKLDMTRFWNWQDSPIPFAAPEIAALQAGGKTQNISQSTGQLEPPVIQQIAPVPLPDPQGLAAIINAITTSNMFRDMSGAAQAAALAQAAMQAAALAATAAGSQAGQNMETAAKYSLEYIKAVLPLIQSLGGKATSPMNSALSPGGANVSEVGALMNYASRLNQGQNERTENSKESGLVFAGDNLARTGGGTTDYEVEAFKSLIEPDSNFVEAILTALTPDTSSTTESTSTTNEKTPLLSLPDTPDHRVAIVMENIAAIDRDAQSDLRTFYESKFEFKFRNNGFKTPWAGITEDDIQAVLAVADALQVSYASVLALWIHEGKISWNRQFHGVSSDFGSRFGVSFDLTKGHECGPPDPVNRGPDPSWIGARDFPKLRVWALAAVLDCFFGLDYFTRRDLSEVRLENIPVNQLPGRVRQHFKEAVEELMLLASANYWNVLTDPWTPERVLEYFVDRGGALAINLTEDGRIPYALNKASIPSWLVLQSGLFELYAFRFASKLGIQTPLPTWVTYWIFNADMGLVIGEYFPDPTDQAAFEERIRVTFDPSAPGFNPPTNAERNAYENNAPDFRKGKLEAIVHKYLVESVEPFFVLR